MLLLFEVSFGSITPLRKSSISPKLLKLFNELFVVFSILLISVRNAVMSLLSFQLIIICLFYFFLV